MLDLIQYFGDVSEYLLTVRILLIDLYKSVPVICHSEYMKLLDYFYFYILNSFLETGTKRVLIQLEIVKKKAHTAFSSKYIQMLDADMSDSGRIWEIV